MAFCPNTSKAHPQHKLYPYLLRGLDIIRPNQEWSTYITYILLLHGFVYLVAIIDWYSRKVLAWRLSNTMDAGFCVDCLEEAIKNYGVPEIFNTDQGSQFPLNRIVAMLVISWDMLYNRIDFIHRQCLDFAADRERKLKDLPLKRLYLSLDRQDHLVNWTERKDKLCDTTLKAS
jgi:transposase InsO family protein